MNYIILIPVVIIALIIIAFVIYLVANSKKEKETPASILDVNEVGVPSSSEFSYGYEKEETIVMNPVTEEKKEEKEKPEEFPDVSENDEFDITTAIKKSDESENK